LFSSLIVPTLLVLAAWAVLALGFASVGILFLNRLGGPVEPSWQYVFCGIWTGFSLLIAGLMLWNFFLPVDGIALGVFAVASTIALIRERGWVAMVIRVPFDRIFAPVAVLFAVWTANHALAPAGYDDYGYEFSAIRWFHDYRIVPGLANLQGRIGFNDSHHLFAAMLSVGPLRGAVNHVFNGFFVALVCVFILSEVRDLTKATSASRERALFSALLFCPCAGLVLFGPFRSMLSTLKADVFMCVATVSLAILFLRWASAPAETVASRILGATTFLLGCVITSVKLSGSVFCLLIVAVVIVRTFRGNAAKPRHRSVIAAALAAGAVLLVSIPVRSVILSGYPFFPSTAFGFNVDWRVPVPMADVERAIVTSFARLPITREGQPERARWELEGYAEIASLQNLKTNFDPHPLLGHPWVRNWAASILISDHMTMLLPSVLIAATVPLLFVRRRREAWISGESPPVWAYATMSAASVAALVFWFLEAPATRFALADIWILFASILSWAARRQDGQRNWTASLAGLTVILIALAMVVFDTPYLQREERLRLLALLVFAGFWFVAFLLVQTAKPQVLAAICLLPSLFQHGERLVDGGQAGVRSMLWINYFPHHAPVPVLQRTCSGLGIYRTDRPDFETPLPSTQRFNALLRLRTARLEDGFTVRDCSAPK
jgi:hypothetical protein